MVSLFLGWGAKGLRSYMQISMHGLFSRKRCPPTSGMLSSVSEQRPSQTTFGHVKFGIDLEVDFGH